MASSSKNLSYKNVICNQIANGNEYLLILIESQLTITQLSIRNEHSAINEKHIFSELLQVRTHRRLTQSTYHILTFLPLCKVMSKTNLRWRRKRKFPKVKLTILFITNVPYCLEQCESPQLVPIRSIPKACNMFKNKTRKERNKKW